MLIYLEIFVVIDYRKLSIKRYYEALGSIYKDLYKTRMRNLERKIILSEMRKSKIILDIGCGDGYHFYKMARYGKVIGLDISKSLLLEFKKNTKSICVLADAEKLPFKDSSIDIVVSIFGALNHCNIVNSVKEIFRVLKKGGLFIFTVANKYNIFYIINNIKRLSIRKVLRSIIKGEGYIHRYIFGKRYRVWTRFYSLYEIIKVLNMNGFKVLKIYGLNKNGILFFVPISFLSEYIGIVCEKNC